MNNNNSTGASLIANAVADMDAFRDADGAGDGYGDADGEVEAEVVVGDEIETEEVILLSSKDMADADYAHDFILQNVSSLKFEYDRLGSIASNTVIFLFEGIHSFERFQVPTELCNAIKNRFLYSNSTTTSILPSREYDHSMKSIFAEAVSRVTMRSVPDCKECCTNGSVGLGGPVQMASIGSNGTLTFVQWNSLPHCKESWCRYFSEMKALRSYVSEGDGLKCACCAVTMFRKKAWTCKCGIAKYCSKRCQGENWWNHRWICKEIRNHSEMDELEKVD